MASSRRGHSNRADHPWRKSPSVQPRSLYDDPDYQDRLAYEAGLRSIGAVDPFVGRDAEPLDEAA